ncbi:hypothetical protein IEQ34_000737 [Dendrobium chrysotoxum]|uniref:tRNA/rRNA methyltransferase SpoU type domain-containing protein n=1 Tax=Dendrobium chrysotoxum TaxID=161865 RepID=A0AAV7HB26_DENCH|nr:hypothetical protein IEQ34_000737 [Dendrobium chrysotoxum]
MLAGHPENYAEASSQNSLLSANHADSLANRPLCLVLGSEGHGLSLEALQSCELVGIPMAGMFESVNVSVAAWPSIGVDSALNELGLLSDHDAPLHRNSESQSLIPPFAVPDHNVLPKEIQSFVLHREPTVCCFRPSSFDTKLISYALFDLYWVCKGVKQGFHLTTVILSPQTLKPIHSISRSKPYLENGSRVFQRTIVGGRWRSERTLSRDIGRKVHSQWEMEGPLSGDRGQKDYSRRASEIKRTIVGGR